VVRTWKETIFGQHKGRGEQVTMAAQDEGCPLCSPAMHSLSKSWKVHLAEVADGALICIDSSLRHTAIRR
jgi:hypothetical protein